MSTDRPLDQPDRHDPPAKDEVPAAGPPLVVAEGLSLVSKHGPVFTDLELRWPESGLAAVVGPSGSGRSSLLLAVVGRMRGLTGRLRVTGLDAVKEHRAVAQRTSIARISDLVELEGQLTVAECITERALIDAVAPQHAEKLFSAAEQIVGFEVARRDLIDELSALEQAVVAVILATLRPSRLVVLDDADARLDLADQRRLYEALKAIAATGPAIVVSTTEAAALPDDVPRIALTRPTHVKD
jgi:ABC-2 type transport system ATP-binding protein